MLNELNNSVRAIKCKKDRKGYELFNRDGECIHWACNLHFARKVARERGFAVFIYRCSVQKVHVYQDIRPQEAKTVSFNFKKGV